nr:B3 domain-containing protein At5g60140-like [Ipomoea batatas]
MGKVVKDNCVTDGDQLFFIYKDYDLFDFFVVGTFCSEKIGVEGERARVVEVIRKESGDESRDIFILEANIWRYIQPENAYFVMRIRQKRRGDLYVLKEVIRDYNLQLPSTVTLPDVKGREWKTIVKVWADGRTWLSGGWRGRLCRRNLIGEEDQCICEFLPSGE